MSLPAAFAAKSKGSVSDKIVSVPRANDMKFLTLSVGPAFSTGLDYDNLMLDLTVAMNQNLSEKFSGKVFGDAALGSSTNSGRFLNIGLGSDYYPTKRQIANSTPYFTADAGLGFTRNANDNTENGLAIGAGGGFRFTAKESAWDLNLHYTLLTANNEGGRPFFM